MNAVSNHWCFPASRASQYHREWLLPLITAGICADVEVQLGVRDYVECGPARGSLRTGGGGRQGRQAELGAVRSFGPGPRTLARRGGCLYLLTGLHYREGLTKRGVVSDGAWRFQNKKASSSGCMSVGSEIRKCPRARAIWPSTTTARLCRIHSWALSNA